MAIFFFSGSSIDSIPNIVFESTDTCIPNDIPSNSVIITRKIHSICNAIMKSCTSVASTEQFKLIILLDAYLTTLPFRFHQPVE